MITKKAKRWRKVEEYNRKQKENPRMTNEQEQNLKEEKTGK